MKRSYNRISKTFREYADDEPAPFPIRALPPRPVTPLPPGAVFQGRRALPQMRVSPTAYIRKRFERLRALLLASLSDFQTRPIAEDRPPASQLW